VLVFPKIILSSLLSEAVTIFSIKIYIFLIFLNFPEQGLTPTERLWQPQESTGGPQFLWKNMFTAQWHSPSPVPMWGQGHACVFLEGAEHPV
jgi:hypothetical protein